jgi:hypothetical protein
MPEVWATFEEIAQLFELDPAGARNHVIASQWERRRFSDGVTRAILPPEAAHMLMIGYVAQLDSCDRMEEIERTAECFTQLTEQTREHQAPSDQSRKDTEAHPWSSATRSVPPIRELSGLAKVQHEFNPSHLRSRKNSNVPMIGFAEGNPFGQRHCGISPLRACAIPPMPAM